MNRKVLIIPAIILAIIAVVVVVGVVIPAVTADPNSPVGFWGFTTEDCTVKMEFLEDGTGWLRENYTHGPLKLYRVEWINVLDSGIYHMDAYELDGELARTEDFKVVDGKIRFL